MATRLMQDETIPQLDGWTTLPEAAKRLGVSRQYAYKLASDGYFESLHRLGEATLVVSLTELENRVKLRKEKAKS